jgi:glycosyltransferase involved in cell wall biosynthesis
VRILWLLPDFGYNAAARQAFHIVPELIRMGHSVVTAALRAGGGMVEEMRQRELSPRELAAPADMPVKCLIELDKILKDEPFDLVHTWRLPAARAMGTSRLARSHRPKLLVSQPKRGAKWNPLDRLLLARVDCLAADVGESGPRLPSVPLAVEVPEPKPWPMQLGIPDGARVIFCIGDFTSEHSFRDAIWAFDVLKYVYAELRLVLVGDGPEREALMRFGNEVIGATDRVHFLTDRTEGPSLLTNAEMVWVPSRKRCGEQVALEAQASGVPVVATNLPGMATVLGNGQSGVLVPPGEPVEMAKAARPVLDDPNRRCELIEAGRKAIGSEHAPEAVARRWLEVYAEVAAKRASA